jgi:hypothetical protein
VKLKYIQKENCEMRQQGLSKKRETDKNEIIGFSNRA